MASEKDTQARATTTKRTPSTTININTNSTRKQRPPQTETEQPVHTAEPAATSSTEGNTEPAKPRIYDQPQRMDSYSARQTLYASPLAATLYARFNPDDPREQPFEHAIFIDPRLSKRGFI